MSKKSTALKKNLRISARILSIAWRLRPWVYFTYFAGAVLEISTSILTIYATAQIAGLLAHFITSGNYGHIWLWLWIDIIAVAFNALSFALMSFSRRLLYMEFGKWATVEFQSALCRIDLPDYYDETTRNEINKVASGYTWQISNLAQANFDLIYGVLRFATITLVISQITWWIVPIIILFLIPSLFVEGRIAKLLWFVWDSKGDERQVFWGFDWILRQPKGQMELRSSQSSKFAVNKIATMLDAFYKEQEAKYKQASKAIFPSKIFEVIGTALGSVVLLKQVLSKTISLDRYFFLSGMLFRVGTSLNTIFATLANMQETFLFAESFFNLVDTEQKNQDIPNAVNLGANKEFYIQFENVTFRYPGETLPVFEHFNLGIKSGEHIALVGENGAGKSTLIKLLMRFYKPESGRILVNGHDLNDIAIESWYKHVATLFQDFNHYPLPINENIQIGRSDQKPDQSLLLKAAKFGDVDSMVKNYKNGWNTVLDASFKKGVDPSGGQWQRIALARAFYRQADIIILDEPTSAIDAKAEYNIFNSIFKHYHHKTALIVSHRFSTVRRANRIVVIDKGKIIEQGSHKELMKTKGLYAELFSKQAEGYK